MNSKRISTLGKFENILKLKNYSDNTIKIYMHYVDQFLIQLDKPGLHITGRDIEHYLKRYSYTSISQQNQIYSSLKQFARHILKIKNLGKIILERPRKEKKLPKVIDSNFLLERLDLITNLKHKAILSIAYSVGLRVSEVINLKIKDIDSNRMIIHIKNAKGRKDRIVPLSKTILDLLRSYFVKFRPNEFLFNGQFRNTYSATSCNKLVKKYLGNDYHFHLLRHSSFTTMLESGTDLRIIQKIAGHNSSRTTEIYAHVSNNLISKVQLPI